MLRFPKMYAVALLFFAITLATLVQLTGIGKRSVTAGSIDMASEAPRCPNQIGSEDEKEFTLPDAKDKSVKAMFDSIKKSASDYNIPLLLLHSMTGTFQMAHETHEIDLEGLIEANRNFRYQWKEAQKAFDIKKADLDAGKIDTKDQSQEAYRKAIFEEFSRGFQDYSQAQKDFDETISGLLKEKLQVDLDRLYWTLAFGAKKSGGVSLVISLSQFLAEKIRNIESVQQEAEQNKVSEDRSRIKLVTKADFNFLNPIDLTQGYSCPGEVIEDIVVSLCGNFVEYKPNQGSFPEYLLACHKTGTYAALTRMGSRRKNQMLNDVSLKNARDLTLCSDTETVQFSEGGFSVCKTP